MRSEPGVTRNGVLALTPALSACIAMWAARFMSSYEELVQEPMSAWRMPAGQPSFFTSAASFEMGRARSGECGPTMWGSSSERLISTTSS